jgi:hypothetical protein
VDFLGFLWVDAEFSVSAHVELDFASEGCDVAVFDFYVVVDVDLVDLVVPECEFDAACVVADHGVGYSVDYVSVSCHDLAWGLYFCDFGLDFDSFHSVFEFFYFQNFVIPFLCGCGFSAMFSSCWVCVLV